MRKILFTMLALALSSCVQPLPVPKSPSQAYLAAKLGVAGAAVSKNAYKQACYATPTSLCVRVGDEAEAIIQAAHQKIVATDAVLFAPECGEYGCVNSPVNISLMDATVAALDKATHQLHSKLGEKS